MNIGFDAKRAFLNRTGLGNYSRWLITALSRYQPQNNYTLYTPRTNPAINFSVENSSVKLPESKFTSYWRSKGIIADLKKDHVQLYHGLSHELPFGIKKSGIKSVVTIHDVIVLRFPHYFSFLNRAIYKAKLKYACKVADAIVAISQKTKDDIVTYLGIPENKVKVIYQSCDKQFREIPSAEKLKEVKTKYQLPEQYLLSVGTIEERKNLLLLAKALRDVADIKLVVVGKPTAYLNEVKAYLESNGLTDRIVFLHSVAFQDLPAIYQQAECFIYPSRYEGFGLPILEAISLGVPVIAATGSCLEEAGGPDSLYVNPDDAQGLANKIRLVLTDKNLSAKMIDAGLTYSRKFDDKKLAAQYTALYQNIIHA